MDMLWLNHFHLSSWPAGRWISSSLWRLLRPLMFSSWIALYNASFCPHRMMKFSVLKVLCSILLLLHIAFFTLASIMFDVIWTRAPSTTCLVISNQMIFGLFQLYFSNSFFMLLPHKRQCLHVNAELIVVFVKYSPTWSLQCVQLLQSNSGHSACFYRA